MAWVTSVERKEGNGNIHPTQLVAFVKVFATSDKARIVQIDTHGSDDRAFPKKQSQTLQLGREAARELYNILRDTYGFE